MKSKQMLLAIDQFINVCFFNGYADETISARAYRNSLKGVKRWVIARRVIDGIFFWQQRHCQGAYMNEVARVHMPVAYRESLEKVSKSLMT